MNLTLLSKPLPHYSPWTGRNARHMSRVQVGYIERRWGRSVGYIAIESAAVAGPDDDEGCEGKHYWIFRWLDG